MFLVFVIIFGVLTGVVAQNYGRNAIGWGFAGAAMFIIAMPCLLLSGPLNTQKCSECKELVKDGARKCKHCGASLSTSHNSR